MTDHATTIEFWAREDQGQRGRELREAAAELRRLQAENASLWALARFGEWCLDELGHGRLSDENYMSQPVALQLGLLTRDVGEEFYEPTPLATLPEKRE